MIKRTTYKFMLHHDGSAEQHAEIFDLRNTLGALMPQHDIEADSAKNGLVILTIETETVTS